MNKAFVFIERALTALPVFLINLYRKYLSPLKKPSCRFSPTCSVYALGALKEWGLICGTALTLWRLVRCNPFSKGGYDPVPERKFLKNIGNTKNSHDRK